MVKKRSSVEELTTPATLHRKQGSSYCLYLYAASVSETHHVLRYSTPYVRFFIFLDGAKIRSFIETTKLFLRKFHFISNFSPKNLHKSIFCYTFAPEQ